MLAGRAFAQDLDPQFNASTNGSVWAGGLYRPMGES